MDLKTSKRGIWLNVLALLFSLFGVIVSASGALSTYYSQAKIPEAPLWPLPGLALSYWVILGLVSFMAIGITSFSMSTAWLQTEWAFTGAFIPLIVIGAFSIGKLVLIVFLLSLLSTSLLSARIRPQWLRCLGYFLVGAICSLLVLLLMINLSNASL